MRISQITELVTGDQMLLFASMQPAVGRRIIHPWMRGANVIGDNIEQDLQAQSMRSADERAVIVERAEMFFHGVEVGCAVAVIIATGVVIVVVNRSNPEGGNAEVFEIWQVLLDAFEIAAVIGLRIVAIVCA